MPADTIPILGIRIEKILVVFLSQAIYPIDMEFNLSQKEFLSSNLIPLRLSCLLPNGFPLTVSLWFKLSQGKLVCASGKSSKIISYLQNSSKVGFEIASDQPPYCGIRGYGTASLHEDTDHQVIKELYLRYFENDDSKLYRFLTSDSREEMVITIQPEQIYDWNFSERMQDSRFRQSSTICP